jgi:hypothetical protein
MDRPLSMPVLHLSKMLKAAQSPRLRTSNLLQLIITTFLDTIITKLPDQKLSRMYVGSLAIIIRGYLQPIRTDC